jgi:hypothetical protein
MDPDRELEGLLRANRPRPDADWVRATEDRLLPRRRSWRPSPTVRVGAAFAGGLAALMLGISLADSNSNDAVQAKDRCRSVTVTRVERVPALVLKDGQPRIVYSRKPVQRTVKRCG